MHPAVKSNAIDETEARRVAGDEAVNRVLAENCDFSNRVIDDYYNVVEMSASVDIDLPDGPAVLVINYLIGREELDALDDNDLGALSYNNYTFEII